MYVVATAGHVDHGKSTLVHQLTGTQPDRWAEERRRGLTIDLGFAWYTLPNGERLAFVDVPGHERFVPNMLAGVGPVPAVLFVVAADEGWRAQSTEHLAALDALDVRHGLLAVTRSDLADPEPARQQALDRIGRTSLGEVPSVVVSGRTGAGLDALTHALTALGTRLPVPDQDADVRLWVDRSFTVKGAGTVVTGTLRAGRLRTGDELLLSEQRVRVRGLQALGADRDEVGAVARVAVNLRGVERVAVERGDALLTPAAWPRTDVVDVRLRSPVRQPKGALVLHLGSAAVPVRVRPLGDALARLALARPLPLRVGDRGLLRDPGRHEVVAGVHVLDVRPPALDRRGAASARATELAGVEGPFDLAELRVRRRGFVPANELRAMGLPEVGRPIADGWYVHEAHWAGLIDRAVDELRTWQDAHPLDIGPPADVLRRRLDLPAAVLDTLLDAAGLTLVDGRIRQPGKEMSELPPAVENAVHTIEVDLRARPYVAPDADRLTELGLGTRELAAAIRAGRLDAIADGLVLLPGAVERAADPLAELPQPFTLSQAKQALGTTRRVAVPLLELLDRRGVTERLPDGTHRLRLP